MTNSRAQNRRALRRAFSLVELIVAISIMAILVAVVAPKLGRWLGFAKTNRARAEVETISQQVRMHMSSQGLASPPSGFDLIELTEGNDPLLKAADLNDPWGNPYMIRIPGQINTDYDIVSYGADGQPGGENDDADIISGDKKK